MVSSRPAVRPSLPWSVSESLQAIPEPVHLIGELGLTGARLCDANHNPENYDPKLLANYLPTALGGGYLDQLIQDASFVKLREVSATYQLPRRFVRGFSGASITLAGRELATWTDYRGLDPESATGTGGNFQDQAVLPPLTRYVLTLNLNW